MRLTQCALFFALSIFCSACSTGYHPEGFFSNGYSDLRLSYNTFSITYTANEHTPPEQVMEYAIQRATEVARGAGFSYFAVTEVSRAGSSKVRLHYPSIRLTIECFNAPIAGKDLIEIR